MNYQVGGWLLGLSTKDGLMDCSLTWPLVSALPCLALCPRAVIGMRTCTHVRSDQGGVASGFSPLTGVWCQARHLPWLRPHCLPVIMPQNIPKVRHNHPVNLKMETLTKKACCRSCRALAASLALPNASHHTQPPVSTEGEDCLFFCFWFSVGWLVGFVF